MTRAPASNEMFKRSADIRVLSLTTIAFWEFRISAIASLIGLKRASYDARTLMSSSVLRIDVLEEDNRGRWDETGKLECVNNARWRSLGLAFENRHFSQLKEQKPYHDEKDLIVANEKQKR